MPAVTVRNLMNETYQALKSRAAQHGRSTAAEIRHILDNAVRPGIGIGSALAEIGRSLGGIKELKRRHDNRPVAPANFEH